MVMNLSLSTNFFISWLAFICVCASIINDEILIGWQSTYKQTYFKIEKKNFRTRNLFLNSIQGILEVFINEYVNQTTGIIAEITSKN